MDTDKRPDQRIQCRQASYEGYVNYKENVESAMRRSVEGAKPPDYTEQKWQTAVGRSRLSQGSWSLEPKGSGDIK